MQRQTKFHGYFDKVSYGFAKYCFATSFLNTKKNILEAPFPYFVSSSIYISCSSILSSLVRASISISGGTHSLSESSLRRNFAKFLGKAENIRCILRVLLNQLPSLVQNEDSSVFFFSSLHQHVTFQI